MFVAGEDIGVTVAVSVARCSPTVAALWGLFYWGEAERAAPRALAYIAAAVVSVRRGDRAHRAVGVKTTHTRVHGDFQAQAQARASRVPRAPLRSPR